MQKICPRCKKTFVCAHQDIANCWCMSANISSEVMEHIADKYPNKCLCKSCMDELHKVLKGKEE